MLDVSFTGSLSVLRSFKYRASFMCFYLPEKRFHTVYSVNKRRKTRLSNKVIFPRRKFGQGGQGGAVSRENSLAGYIVI